MSANSALNHGPLGAKLDERLIFAMSGTESLHLLEEISVHYEVLGCEEVNEVVYHLSAGAAALILEEEFITEDSVSALKAFLNRQPLWSDLPLLILSRSGPAAVEAVLHSFPEAVVLTRPLSPSLLYPCLAAAVSRRTRQYLIRTALDERKQLKDNTSGRSESERVLREQIEDFKRLTDAVPAPVLYVNRSERVIFVNAEAESFFGAERSIISGRTLSTLFDSQGYLQSKPYIRQVLKGKPVRFETVLTTSGDRQCSVLVRLSPYRSVNQELLGFWAAFTDISEMSQDRRSLQRSRRRFRALADAMPQIVWTAGRTGSIDYFNARWFDLSGLRRSQSTGRLWQRALHPDDASAFLEGWAQAVKHERRFEAECRLFDRRTGAFRWHLCRAISIRDTSDSTSRWYGTFTDIHENRTNQEALKLADRRKDEFMAILAHELRNPLAAVCSGIALLARPQDEQRRVWIQEMLARQAKQLQRLVEDITDISRLTRGKVQLKLQVVNLQDSVRQAVTGMQDEIDQQGHHLELVLPQAPLYLRADPARLEQIIVNLLSNACKYTPTGGNLSLVVTPKDDEFCLSLTDNGEGLEPEALETIFEMFTQAGNRLHRSREGLGLGLALVKKLAELHGGGIKAFSEGRGRGSRFEVTLPLVEHSTAVSPRNASFGFELETTRSYSVLVIDDNKDLANSIAAFLEDAGHRVEVAYDGEAALPMSRRMRPDVVLVDIALPGKNGYQVTQEIRKDSSYAPLIIAISGYGQAEDRNRSRRSGVDHHLTKPVSFDHLLMLINRYERRTRRSKLNT